MDGAESEDEEGCVGNEDVKDFTLLLVDTDDGEGDVGLQAVIPPPPPPVPPCPPPVPPLPPPPPPAPPFPPPPPDPAELLGAPDITLKLL